MKKETKHMAASLDEQRKMLCSNLSFAGAEAYKRLRTNILLSFPEEQRCRVVGVTSAVRGEGKSLTSINLAYTFAETGKKVLLVEADMRLPNLAKRLNLSAAPGLSNLLVGMAKGNDVLQHMEGSNNLYVITAGDIPPNPSELLGAERMKTCVQAFAESFDYVIIDLPPINIVSDAAAISRLVDGFVFVVRQDYSTKQSVSQAMNQLSIIDAKILGFVMNQSAAKVKAYKYNNTDKAYDYDRPPAVTLASEEPAKKERQDA